MAFVKYLGKESGRVKFRADIGSNTFYNYKIGRSVYGHRGLKLIDETTFISPIGRVANRNNMLDTSFFLDIPQELFENDSHFIQLFSYKSKNMMSPAISEIERVQTHLSTKDFRLPEIMSYNTDTSAIKQEVPTYSAPFAIHETSVSESMFLNGLIGALPGFIGKALPALGKMLPVLEKGSGIADNILPHLLPLLTNPINGSANGTTNASNTGNGHSNQEMAIAILAVVQRILEKVENLETESARNQTRAMTINPSMLVQIAPLLEKVMSPETIRAIGESPVKLLKAVADSALKLQKMEYDHLENINPGLDDTSAGQILQGMSVNGKSKYSEAKVAPALLAALPALMPLLKNLLNPETIKAIGESPVKLLKAISDAGLKHQKQELDHLERINPGVDDPDILPLLNSMSLNSSSDFGIASKYSERFSIQFVETSLLTVQRKEKLIYSKEQKIRFPIKINSKNSNSKATHIPKAILQVLVQDSQNMRVLSEKKFKVLATPLDQVVDDIVLDSQDLQNLPSNKELKLEVTLLWKNKKGQTFGTFKNHYFYLADTFIFLQDSGKAESSFSLNDVNEHRSFWHKVWEGSPSTHERWEIGFECKYFTKISSTKKQGVGKLESRRVITSDSNKNDKEEKYRRKIQLKLKSGMSVDLSTLNLLLERSGFEKLNPAKLHAFYDEAYLSSSGNLARTSVEFRGKKGETATLWTYPEGHFEKYQIGKISNINSYGMITGFEEEEVIFPQFTAINFIGTQSE